MMMQKFKNVFIAISLFVGVWLCVSFMPRVQDVFELKPAVQSDCVKIAVIYAKRIKQEADCFVAFEKHFEKERQALHNIFLEKESQLRLEYELLEKMPSSKEKQRRNVEHQAKILKTEKELQQSKENFLSKINAITTALQQNLDRAITLTISKYGFTMVLNAELDDKTLVMYAEKRYDITDKVIENLNNMDIQFD
ncbi:MAG: OmpH family outer membrane protein [Alphaproteobacteria bacterium]|nr:OmpH family outer membrane protein [Alphaproteobacteria bacterium]